MRKLVCRIYLRYRIDMITSIVFPEARGKQTNTRRMPSCVIRVMFTNVHQITSKKIEIFRPTHFFQYFTDK